MANLYLIVDQMENWSPYYTTEQVITAHSYLTSEDYRRSKCQIYNLCGEFNHRSTGYYCSLLAQAREHNIMPSVKTINQLTTNTSIKLNVDVALKAQVYLNQILSEDISTFKLQVYFGSTKITELQKLARKVFESYPAPILEIEFDRSLNWQIKNIRLVALTELNDEQQDEFSLALDNFSTKVWRKPRNSRSTRYDLAILIDPQETLPPSNKSALQQFVRHAKKLDIEAEFIMTDQIGRLLEYDALFIRQTTAINHPTYHFAQLAESYQMPVIDDPDSIIKCTNKVFLHELLGAHRVCMPKSRILFRNNLQTFDEVVQELSLPLVLKIPDGSSSFGVSKVENHAEFLETTNALFKLSDILIAQQYIPTDFDWRIGVLNGEVIYTCKYHMAPGHWQIYNHGAKRAKTGDLESVSIYKVPREVIKTALKATSLIGKGLYGVDIKITQDAVFVIEVNDNPTIDRGEEDAYSGDYVYQVIMENFLHRLEDR